jgi:uncharacterized protein (TIGR02117 family)
MGHYGEFFLLAMDQLHALSLAPETVPAMSSQPVSRPSLLICFAKRSLQLLALVTAVYTGFVLLGFIPVNCDYVPPDDADCVTIFIRSNEIHTDLVVPVCHEGCGLDWRELVPPQHFSGDVRECRHIAFGWGNRAFYVDTPTWSDLQPLTALRAIFPAEGVLHAEYLSGVKSSVFFREVRLSREQYQQLAEFIRTTVCQTDELGHAVPATSKRYSSCDRFYYAAGSYHAFNTCNQWTGRGLQQAGVPTGLWTPLKPQVLCWLR